MERFSRFVIQNRLSIIIVVLLVTGFCAYSIKDLGFNDNAKVVLLVGKVGDNDYEIVKVDSDGKIYTTT